MKINLPIRMRNPWFWVGILGVVLTAMGVSPEHFTTWGAVKEQFIALIKNPYMLCSVALAVLGVFIDPTTKGVEDSDRAMTYTELK